MSTTLEKNEFLYLKRLSTPVGKMLALADDDGVCMLEFGDSKNLEKEIKEISKKKNKEVIENEHSVLKTLEIQLKEYFSGKRTTFEIPMSPVGTDFQLSVWKILNEIPYGKTMSYQKQAELLGDPKSVRAVANANGQNKMSILIPCHRVIGSNGKLTGYGGGIWRKQKLLELEKAILF